MHRWMRAFEDGWYLELGCAYLQVGCVQLRSAGRHVNTRGELASSHDGLQSEDSAKSPCE